MKIDSLWIRTLEKKYGVKNKILRDRLWPKHPTRSITYFDQYGNDLFPPSRQFVQIQQTYGTDGVLGIFPGNPPHPHSAENQYYSYYGPAYQGRFSKTRQFHFCMTLSFSFMAMQARSNTFSIVFSRWESNSATPLTITAPPDSFFSLMPFFRTFNIFSLYL